MNKTLTTLMASAFLLAGSALANDTAATVKHPIDSAKATANDARANAANRKDKIDADYKVAKDRADAQYKEAKDRCSAMKGANESACKKEAKADHDKAVADAKAAHDKAKAEIERVAAH